MAGIGVRLKFRYSSYPGEKLLIYKSSILVRTTRRLTQILGSAALSSPSSVWDKILPMPGLTGLGSWAFKRAVRTHPLPSLFRVGTWERAKQLVQQMSFLGELQDGRRMQSHEALVWLEREVQWDDLCEPELPIVPACASSCHFCVPPCRVCLTSQGLALHPLSGALMAANQILRRVPAGPSLVGGSCRCLCCSQAP
jgi:hypothetical protein